MSSKVEKMRLKRKLEIFIAALTFACVSCGHFQSQEYVEFDNASLLCRESRDLVLIESKMIPSDERLDTQAKSRSEEGLAVDATLPVESDYKLINESDEERFVTIPSNKFAVATVGDEQRLLYWIHFVSSDLQTLDDAELEPSAHFKKINEVLRQFHSAGTLRAKGWEPKLNDAILKQLQSIKKFRKITRVYIHLGC